MNKDSFSSLLCISVQIHRAIAKSRISAWQRLKGYLMKIATILSVACGAVVLTSVGLAASYDELAAKGYRWVTVDGPYGCPSQDDLRQITKNRTDAIELRMVEQIRADYLIPGGLVRLVQQDAASGMTQIHSAEIVTDLWT